MKTLRKNLLAAAVVASLGLSAVALAGPWGGPGPMSGGGGDCPMWGGGRGGPGGPGGGPQQRMAMMQQFHAEQMELLEARLKLKPDQQNAWKAFLAAQDAHHAEMIKMRQEMRGRGDTTTLAHFQDRVQFMEQNLASMKAMARAAGDLYATLDPAQKKVMDDFFTSRPMHRMMRGQAAQPVPPAPPAPPAQ